MHLNKRPFIFLLIIAWFVVASLLTWQRTRGSLPPIWDQQSYLEKAEAFWNAAAEGNPKNPLNIEPTFRPPGTILVTAPLGPLKDYRNYYFRSIFLAVVIMVLAVFITAFGITRQEWPAAYVAVLSGSTPMFWQLTNIGLVDSFQAGIAAFAMAGLLVATVRFQQIWILPALVALALLPLIKPSGFLLGILITLVWFAIALRFAKLHPHGRRGGWLAIVRLGIMMVLVQAFVAIISLNSEYLSAKNISFGQKAVAQLKGDWALSLGLMNNPDSLTQQSIGVPVLLTVAVVGIIALLRRNKTASMTTAKESNWLASIGLVVIITGLILCWQATLFRQVRYIYPFLAVAIVLFAPTVAAWSQRAGVGVSSVLAVPPLSLLIFLGWPRLDISAYNLGGYILSNGYSKEELNTGYAVVSSHHAKNPNGPPPVLFNMVLFNMHNAEFEAGYTQRLRDLGYKKEQIAKAITRPYNWEEGGVVRVSQIYNADILAIDTLSPPQVTNGQLSFVEEQNQWNKWLLTTPTAGTTELVGSFPSLVVMRVKDRSALRNQMLAFIRSRPWREEFLAANEPEDFSVAEVRQLPLVQLGEPVRYGDAVRLHGLSMTHISGGNQQVLVQVYSEPLSAGRGKTLSLFLHQLDSQGKTLASHELPLRWSRVPDHPISLNHFSITLVPETTHLGLGIFDPKIGALVTDWSQAREWDQRRASFKVSSLPVVTDSKRKKH